MAELLAAGAAARLAVAAFSAAAAERDVAPELKALQLRVLAAASSVESMGASAAAAHVAPLVKTLQEATAWIERREGKLEAQSWLHRAAMSAKTKAEIARLDAEITKCASTPARAIERALRHARDLVASQFTSRTRLAADRLPSFPSSIPSPPHSART